MPDTSINNQTFRMSLLTYTIRKVFRPKIMIFDLDDTLFRWPRKLKLKGGGKLNFHRYVANIFAKVICEYLRDYADSKMNLKEGDEDFARFYITKDEASEFCEEGYRLYGSSMIALIEEYPELDDDDLASIFLSTHQRMATHERKGVNAWVKPNFMLIESIRNLKTAPFILTHGSTPYAKIVLKALGLSGIIPDENIFGMDLYGYHNTKNTYAPYVWIQQKISKSVGKQVPFNRLIMSEDSHKNLVTAHNLGIKTVLLQRPNDLGEPLPDYPYVDHTHQTQDYLWMFLDKGINYTENKQDRHFLESYSENTISGASFGYF